MLVIRLTRKGKKNQPFFRVVVIDKRRSAKGGRAVEILGYVDPLTKRKSIKKERILYWISKGAKPSATVYNLLISEKIIVPTGIRSRILDEIGKGKKIHVSRVKAKKGEEAAKSPEVKTEFPAAAPPVEALTEAKEPEIPATQASETSIAKKPEETKVEAPEEELKKPEEKTA